MNLGQMVERLEDDLDPPSRFAAWLEAEASGDTATSARLMVGGSRVLVSAEWKPAGFYVNAAKDVAGLLCLLVAPEIGKLRAFPLIDLYATQLDNLIGQAAYDNACAAGVELSETEWENVFADASKVAHLDLIDQWKTQTLRWIGSHLQAFERFASAEGFDGRLALRVLCSCLADDLDAIDEHLVPVGVDEAIVDRAHQGYAAIYVRTLRGQSFSQVAPREAVDTPIDGRA
ncbi:MAG TPA: hypothetical protein VGO31_07595 [Microbacteriaceae bacterium]|jgi:hypothetical protein|nr:hypothetical protein [Microbacteriaceae bacterium]